MTHNLIVSINTHLKTQSKGMVLKDVKVLPTVNMFSQLYNNAFFKN